MIDDIINKFYIEETDQFMVFYWNMLILLFLIYGSSYSFVWFIFDRLIFMSWKTKVSIFMLSIWVLEVYLYINGVGQT